MADVLAYQLNATKKYFSALNAWDFATLDGLLSPDFTYAIGPASLAASGIAPPSDLSMDDTFAFYKTLSVQIETFGFEEPTETVQEKDKIAIWIKSNGKSRTNRPFINVSVLLFHFTPGRDRISRVKTMTDSLQISQTRQAALDAGEQV